MSDNMTEYGPEAKPGEGRRGALSKKEKDTICTLAESGTSVLEIAKKIGRGRQKAAIERVLRENNVPHPDLPQKEHDYNVYKNKLYDREYWKEVQGQFDKSELAYFQDTWINLMIQFRENVLFSEELQIKQLITTDIMINRNLTDRRKHTEDIERMQRLLDEAYALSDDQRNDDRLVEHENQISYARNSMGSFTGDYTKLLDKQKDINKDLKATRDQRIKRVEDSKTSFQGWLLALENEVTRERIGYDAGIMKLAKEKAKKEMSEYHQYVDDQVDQPFLTPDTVKDE